MAMAKKDTDKLEAEAKAVFNKAVLYKKISILKAAKEKFIKQRKLSYGICSVLSDDYAITIDGLELFTLENAIKHANANPEAKEGYFWWPTNTNYNFRIARGTCDINDSPTYDFDNRLLFLDWMISEYEKQLNLLISE